MFVTREKEVNMQKTSIQLDGAFFSEFMGSRRKKFCEFALVLSQQ
jgi:hypothetical protein